MKIPSSGFTPELGRMISGCFDLEVLTRVEEKMVAAFQTPGDVIWREGTVKSCFNYLLLDPDVTQNLPLRARALGEQEAFTVFLSAVFYIGKGKRSRPFFHLHEALTHLQDSSIQNLTSDIGPVSNAKSTTEANSDQSLVKVISHVKSESEANFHSHSRLETVPEQNYHREAIFHRKSSSEHLPCLNSADMTTSCLTAALKTRHCLNTDNVTAPEFRSHTVTSHSQTIKTFNKFSLSPVATTNHKDVDMVVEKLNALTVAPPELEAPSKNTFHRKHKTVGRKVRQILDIWSSGHGVISLHCFQNVIPVEAYTREACMVDALGLNHLTNIRRGDYYGVACSWPVCRRRAVGALLLWKAFQIFLCEGERQIRPSDIRRRRRCKTR